MQGTASTFRPFTAAEQHSDRRKLPRRQVTGGAMAVITSGPGPGQIARIELVDASWSGLGVHSPIAVDPGACISIVPEHTMMARHTGIVVRCSTDGDGYRLGVRCRVAKAVA